MRAKLALWALVGMSAVSLFGCASTAPKSWPSMAFWKKKPADAALARSGTVAPKYQLPSQTAQPGTGTPAANNSYAGAGGGGYPETPTSYVGGSTGSTLGANAYAGDYNQAGASAYAPSAGVMGSGYGAGGYASAGTNTGAYGTASYNTAGATAPQTGPYNPSYTPTATADARNAPRYSTGSAYDMAPAGGADRYSPAASAT